MSRQPARARALALLLLAGCADPDQIVGLVPELPSDVTMIAVLFLDGAGSIIESTGLIRTGVGQNLSLSPGTEDPHEILVVAYDDRVLDPSLRPMDQVLDQAPLRWAAADEPALARPSFVARGPAGDAERLSPSTLPAPLTADWVRPCARTACDRMRFQAPRPVAIPGERHDILRAVLPRPDRQGALFVASSTEASVYRFSAPDRVERIGGPLTGVRTRTAHQLVDGRVVILQQDGSLWMGTHEGAFNLHLRHQSAAEMSNLAVARAGAEPDVYVQDARSRIYVLEPETWRLVYDPGLPATANQALEWLGPSELLSVANDGNALIHLVDGSPVSMQETRHARSPLWVEGLGVVVAAGQALTLFEPGVYLWTPSSLERLPISYGGRSPEASWEGLAPGEFFFGGANGELSSYSAELGVCVLPFFSGEALRAVIWLHEGLLIVPRRADTHEGDTEVVYVPYAEAPRPSCEDAYRAPSATTE